jgi:hypothetical protein
MLQTSKRNSGRVLLQTLASDGVRGLFKGMGAPLATVALFNAVLFATRGQMERILEHSDGEEIPTPCSIPLVRYHTVIREPMHYH